MTHLSSIPGGLLMLLSLKKSLAHKHFLKFEQSVYLLKKKEKLTGRRWRERKNEEFEENEGIIVQQ